MFYFVGSYVCLYPSTLVDLFGTTNIAKAYGMGITAVGFSTLAAVPIAGKKVYRMQIVRQIFSPLL